MIGWLVLAAPAAPAQEPAAPPALPDGLGEADGGPWQDWTLTVGLGGGYGPVYPGSDVYTGSILPFLGVEWRDRVTLGGQAGQGLTVDVAEAGPFKAHVSARYNGGRDSSAAEALDGMGDIPWGVALGGGIEAEWFYGGIEAGASASRVIAGAASGWRGDVSLRLGAPVPGTNGLIAGVRPSVSLGDSGYRNARFGVDQGQAAATGYDTYEPGGGIVTYEVPFVLVYLKQDWLAVAFAGPQRVSDAVAASPINRRRWSFRALAGVGYRFGS